MITVLFSEPFYQGGMVSNLVPGAFDVALAGRPYMLDRNVSGRGDMFGHRTIPLIRQQADTSPNPGEASLNPEDLWRRSVDSWHGGAGQQFLDDHESSPDRFRSSIGVDPWTKGELSLLPAVASKRASASENLRLVTAGDRLYLLDADKLYFTSDITASSVTWTEVTADSTSLTDATGLTSDGERVWVSDGTDIYYTDTNGSTYSTYMASPEPADWLRYVKGRLLAAAGSELFEVKGTAGSASISSILQHQITGWTWVDAAEGANVIYAAGYAGDKSLIYRVTIREDGTDLDEPVVAAQLPDGEVVRSLYGYLGFLMIGTDKGVRFAAPATAGGDLRLGSLIRLGKAPLCFEGQDRFVWFGWTNYDASHTGLGRMDLRTFNDDVPAYASDLMAEAAGDVLSVVTFSERRVFTVSEKGVYVETDDKVPSGCIISGSISYGITEPKTALYLDTQWRGAGTITASISTNGSAWQAISGPQAVNGAGDRSLAVGQARGSSHEIKYELARSATTTVGPVLQRWTLKADPSAPRRVRFVIPLLLYRVVHDRHNTDWNVDVAAERAVIAALAETRQVVTYQEGRTAWPVVIDDYEWVPAENAGHPSFEFDGTLIVTAKSV